MNVTTQSIPTTEPCPRWCAEPAGHPYEDDGLNQPERWHRAWVADTEITRMDTLELLADGVEVLRHSVQVGIRGSYGVLDLEADELPALIRELQEVLRRLT